MAFKFVAKNRETGRTGAVTVKAPSEQSARQKLTLGGYEVVRLMRVSNGLEGSLQYHGPVSTTSVTSTAPAQKQQQSGLCGVLQSLVTRINNAFYYGHF
jgi:hypothetical protein